MRTALLLSLSIAAAAAQPALGGAASAIEAFTAHCFTKGMSAEEAEARLQPGPGGFTLDFYDTTLAPAEGVTPGTDRRCEVRFAGDHTAQALAAVQEKMATPPVFGTPTALPSTHAAQDGTTFIEGRALLRGRLAVVHIGYREDETFIRVERLAPGYE